MSAAPLATDPVLAGYRQAAAAYEQDYDLGHRYGHRAFTLTRLAVSPTEGKTLDVAMARLWPRGLEVTQLSYQQEANATHAFAAALEHEEVRAVLPLVASHAPKIHDYLTLAVDAGRKLGQALRDIDIALAGGTAGSALFEARKAGLTVLAHFGDTVDQVWPAGPPEHNKLRARLVGTYERVLAALAAERAAAAAGATPDPIA